MTLMAVKVQGTLCHKVFLEFGCFLVGVWRGRTSCGCQGLEYLLWVGLNLPTDDKGETTCFSFIAGAKLRWTNETAVAHKSPSAFRRNSWDAAELGKTKAWMANKTKRARAFSSYSPEDGFICMDGYFIVFMSGQLEPRGGETLWGGGGDAGSRISAVGQNCSQSPVDCAQRPSSSYLPSWNVFNICTLTLPLTQHHLLLRGVSLASFLAIFFFFDTSGHLFSFYCLVLPNPKLSPNLHYKALNPNRNVTPPHTD